MNNTTWLSLLILVLTTTVVVGQPFLPDHSGTESKSLDVALLEDNYLSWKLSEPANATTGHKYYVRWLEEQIQRSTSSGHWPDQTHLFEAATLITAAKDIQIQRSPNGWIPVGPAVIPEVGENNLIHGVGRINTVTFHPSDPDIFWVGVAQGGVWKTTDAGEHWRPLTDNLPILRISDIAVDPQNTDVLYVCVGDYAYLGSGLNTDSRKRNTHYGLGVYKTVNGGDTWNPTGLTYDQMDGDGSLMRRVFVSPTNSNILVAAGISGVFTSDNGGDTWVKHLDEVMSDMEMDHNNPTILYAASMHVARIGIGRPAIWKSDNFGKDWTELSTGLDTADVQRIELAIAPSTVGVVYALACGLDGGLYGLYRTTDGGLNWNIQSSSPNILHWDKGNASGGQGTYDLALLVDPFNANKLYAGGINMWGSLDGGLSWKRASYWRSNYGPSIHADQHQYKYNPVDQYYYVCNDGGLNRSRFIELYKQSEINEAGFQFETIWEDLSGGMEITSFYRMDIQHNQEDIIAGAQDNSTYYLRDTQWINTVLGDGMDCFFHPTDPTIAYTSTQYGALTRLENRGSVSVKGLTSQFGFGEQSAWTTPFELDPMNPDGIYTAFENVWRSGDRGETWTQLTDIESALNGLDNLISSSLSISPSDENRFYVTKRIFPTRNRNGEMWRTDDGGLSVVNITEGLPDSLFITASAVHSFNPDLVWATFGGFADGLKVFRSTDAGDHWTNISYSLPNIPVNAVEVVPESINNRVYIGTDVGVYFIDDDMADWEYYSKQLPNVIVTDLVIDSEHEEIYVSTFGRGIWKSDLALISSEKSVEDPFANIRILPNPSKGRFVLSLSLSKPSPVSIEIVDVKGRQVYMEGVDEFHLLLNKTISLDASGLYFVKITTDTGSSVERIVVE